MDKRVFIRKKELHNFNRKYNTSIVFTLNYTFIWIFTIITIGVLLVDLTAVVKLYAKGYSMHDVRIVYASGSNALGNGGALFAVLKSYVTRPFALSIMPLAAIDLFYSSPKRYKLFIASLIITFMQIIVDAGRIGIVQWAFCVVLVYVLIKQKGERLHLSQKAKFRIAITGVSALVILSYISTLRGISDSTESFYTYICGCMPYLDKRLEVVDSSGILTYGFSSFFGITSLISWILSIFGIYIPFFTTVTEVSGVQEYIFISDKINFNAFVTPFYYLYQDGRWIGIVLGMLVYGYICGNTYKKTLLNRNVKIIYVYTILLLGLLFTMVRIPFAKTNYILALAAALLLFKKVPESESRVIKE